MITRPHHYVDVILGLQYGDEGKGKITYSLCKNKKYDFVMRFNGGPNAGHTIYHEGQKFVTHSIPSGIFFGKVIIGPGCVINEDKLLEEVKMFESRGIKVKENLYIAKNAHIITPEHLKEEESETKLGTTKQGIGPAYRDKYSRVGKRVCDSEKLKDFNIIDIYDFLYNCGYKSYTILCEGAQSIHLDIDWGDYPYVTSSHTGLGSIILNGISKSWIKNVYGVAKVYETYVGSKDFENKNEPAFQKIRDIGDEYGATTGRPRKVNWMNMPRLAQSITMNDVNVVIFNKMDVLRQSTNIFKIIDTSSTIKNYSMLYDFNTEKDFTEYLKSMCKDILRVKRVIFSDSMTDCSIS
jgi:adenylosuccinate synthase